jgi:homoserine/homoserine lactone efflux protein
MDSALIGFIVMTAIAAITPGPAVLAVCGAAIGSNTRAALLQIVGTQACNCLYAGAALFGVSLLAAAGPVFFLSMQLFGAAYLCWLGWRTLTALKKESTQQVAQVKELSISNLEAFKRGFVVQLANPKTMLYWFALLPPFLVGATAMSGRALQMVVIGMSIDALAMSLYAVSIGQARALLSSQSAQIKFQISSAIVYLVAGILLGGRALAQSS